MAVRKGKKIKFKFVWTKELIILIVGIIAMLSTVIILDQPSASSKIYKEWAAAATTDSNGQTQVVLSDEHLLKKISLSSLAKKVDSSSKYIYVFYGTPSDATSVANVNTFNNVANYFDISTIYYLNADFVYDETDKEDREFKNKIDDKEAKLSSDCNFFRFPSLWVFKDGALVFNSEDYFDDDTDALDSNWTWKTIAEQWANTGYTPSED